ncbi:hypothetical protein PIB30_047759 [Stylosanthes scabra]|uniref:Uncharacterized protein n=1 Tax=Stylosanthes scabra TaxID=79078 RepID=A0ABU6QHJ3_9FABA|nr:hypothetical protein [Stylosanthes scabra]
MKTWRRRFLESFKKFFFSHKKSLKIRNGERSLSVIDRCNKWMIFSIQSIKNDVHVFRIRDWSPNGCRGICNFLNLNKELCTRTYFLYCL